jgi:5-methylcytosine-specific restriction endonuclease McrA
VEASLIAPDYEPFRSGTALRILGGATVLLLKGFFMGIYLYSQKAIDAYKKKRKRDAAKAKKTLDKLAESSPVIQALIKKKASQIAWAMQKKSPKKKVQFEPPPVYVFGMGKDFYKTREWRDVRYKALVMFGKKCQACGETSGYIHVDHILPRSKYPERELDIENLQVLCEACNIGKSNTDTTDWRYK